MNQKIYPESGVELTGFTAKNYDKLLNIGSFGFYPGFIKKVVRDMEIKPDDKILDLGCGTGRNAEIICAYLGEKGRITGVDISEHMERQFRNRFNNEDRSEFINRRIDIPFTLNKAYDKIFISFVIHGFPHEVRETIIKNAYNHLVPGGRFIIFDFAEFDIEKMPGLYRMVFEKIECKYAFDFIKRDWKEILAHYGFTNFFEKLYMKNYIRLLSARTQ